MFFLREVPWLERGESCTERTYHLLTPPFLLHHFLVPDAPGEIIFALLVVDSSKTQMYYAFNN